MKHRLLLYCHPNESRSSQASLCGPNFEVGFLPRVRGERLPVVANLDDHWHSSHRVAVDAIGHHHTMDRLRLSQVNLGPWEILDVRVASELRGLTVHESRCRIYP